MSSTDMFPKFIRLIYFQPYVVKVLPYLLLFAKIWFDLVTALIAKIKAEIKTAQ